MFGLHFSDCNEFGLHFNFDGCDLNNSTFYQTNIRKTTFKNCKLTEVDFEESNLTESHFLNCDLSGALFFNTNLEKSDFRSSINYCINPAKNRLKKAKFSLSEVSGLLNDYDLVIDKHS